MPCAAGDPCTVPDDTPGPPHFTIHKCSGVCGQYLRGICGVVDPLGTTEVHRICHTCAASRERETSGAGTAGAQPEKSGSSEAKDVDLVEQGEVDSSRKRQRPRLRRRTLT
ncbi:unnamed protein product [Ectocarpus sp. CCAP 1310/34]|nr:unnamed protein product [Ectocarpus sp. CCAP 1310/34]